MRKTRTPASEETMALARDIMSGPLKVRDGSSRGSTLLGADEALSPGGRIITAPRGTAMGKVLEKLTEISGDGVERCTAERNERPPEKQLETINAAEAKRARKAARR
jgi:hypothetical protein